MKQAYYSCESGSLLVITKSKDEIYYDNNYGQCKSKVYEMSEKEFHEYAKEHQQYGISKDIKYQSFVYFNNAEVRIDSCVYIEEDDKTGNNTSYFTLESNFILNGSYEVYTWLGKVFFVKSEVKQ